MRAKAAQRRARHQGRKVVGAVGFGGQVSTGRYGDSYASKRMESVATPMPMTANKNQRDNFKLSKIFLLRLISCWDRKIRTGFASKRSALMDNQ